MQRSRDFAFVEQIGPAWKRGVKPEVLMVAVLWVISVLMLFAFLLISSGFLYVLSKPTIADLAKVMKRFVLNRAIACLMMAAVLSLAMVESKLRPMSSYRPRDSNGCDWGESSRWLDSDLFHIAICYPSATGCFRQKPTFMQSSPGQLGEFLADNIKRAVLSWRDQGIELLPGIAVEEIRHIATLAHISLSADIELLYSLCGGMPSGTVDDQWFELWPLERLLHDAQKFPNSLLPFAEGFLSAHLYCLRVEDASSASVHMDFSFDGKSTEEVAPTLDAMCRMLLDDPRAMYLP